MRRQLSDLSKKICHTLQPVFNSRKICEDLEMREPKPPQKSTFLNSNSVGNLRTLGSSVVIPLCVTFVKQTKLMHVMNGKHLRQGKFISMSSLLALWGCWSEEHGWHCRSLWPFSDQLQLPETSATFHSDVEVCEEQLILWSFGSFLLVARTVHQRHG